MVIVLEKGTSRCPSQVIVASSASMWIEIIDVSGITREGSAGDAGTIGDMMCALIEGCIKEPPAEREYAEEPYCVATNMPSPANVYNSSLLMLVWIKILRAIPLRVILISLRAISVYELDVIESKGSCSML